MADFQSPDMNPGGRLVGDSSRGGLHENLQDEKALDPSLIFNPITRKKSHRDEKL
jgi:hypothetical protein